MKVLAILRKPEKQIEVALPRLCYLSSSTTTIKTYAALVYVCFATP